MKTITQKHNKILDSARAEMICSHKLGIDIMLEEIGKRKSLCAVEKTFFLERLNRSADSILALL